LTKAVIKALQNLEDLAHCLKWQVEVQPLASYQKYSQIGLSCASDRGLEALATHWTAKQLMILSPGPQLGEDVASPPSDREAALLCSVVTPPKSIYSKGSGLSSAGLL
jgi:hypothetical protein